MKKFVMALDQGTTSCRAILFDKAGQIVAVAQKEFTQIYPQAGWVEHNATEIWNTQLSVMDAVLKQNNIDTINFFLTNNIVYPEIRLSFAKIEI